MSENEVERIANIKRERHNYLKALNDIKKYCESNIGTYKSLSEDEYSEACCVDGFQILKIIDEVMENNYD